MSKGVIYFVKGEAYSARLLAAVWSLRKHFLDNVAVLTPDTEETSPVLVAARTMNCKIVPVPLVPIRRHVCYATKTWLHRHTPYDWNVFLDADTLVCNDISEVWPKRKKELVLTQFANWMSYGKIVGGRCEAWRHVCPDLVDRMKAGKYKALNTGVMGFHKQNPALEAWHEMTMKNHRKFIADEIAMQLIYPDWKTRVLDDRWNCSSRHGVNKNEVVIYHGHGRKHIMPPMGTLWLQTIQECYEANVGDCREWLERLMTAGEQVAWRNHKERQAVK